MSSLSGQDMTRGPLAKQILTFSLPLICSNLLQVLFNLADLAVVGQFVGATALGSVGSTTTLVTMFTGFLIGLGGGINVLAARFYGARDNIRFGKLLHTAAILSLSLGILLSIFGVTCARPSYSSSKPRTISSTARHCTFESIFWACRGWRSITSAAPF